MYCPNTQCPDFVATGNHGEYVAGIPTCPACGEYLVDTLPPDEPAPRERTHYTEVDPVFETSDPTEAVVVKGLLESENIPFVTTGAESFRHLPWCALADAIQPGAGTTIFLVPSPIVDTVRQLLEALETED